MWSDLKYALRMMAKTPAYTAVLVLTLALGIGASTTIFSVVNSVVLRPLPYHQPEKLVRVYTEFLGGMNLRKFWVSEPEYWQLKKACRSCASVAASHRASISLSGGERPVQVTAVGATHTLLPTLGVAPMLGRYFDAEEDTPGDRATVIILGHGLWKRAFGGDPSLIGRDILLDARPATVVGVMPPGFDYPSGAEAWFPARLDPASDSWGGHNYDVLVRLEAGVGLGAFRSELDALTTTWAAREGDGHNINFDKHPIVIAPPRTRWSVRSPRRSGCCRARCCSCS
jgi:putative ABC transport system permease protein